MIKLIIFDFDGVLASLRDAHYQSLNNALILLDYPPISYLVHLRIYDGLSTKRKLAMLKIPEDKQPAIFEWKQKFTQQAMTSILKYDPQLVSTFTKLKEENYLLYVASNAIKSTITTGLKIIGILDIVNVIFCNEMVVKQKPDPLIFLMAMEKANVYPTQTLILEDSPHGIAAARASGAHLLVIKEVAETNYHNIKQKIELC